MADELAEFTDELTERMTKRANREILKYAVQRKMFHDCCGTIADVRRSILIEIEVPDRGTGFKLYCRECVNGTEEEYTERILKAVPGAIVTVYDGRELSKR